MDELAAMISQEGVLDMVKVDLAELEKMARQMAVLASDSDDVIGRLQQLNNEMSYDTELLLFPQSQTLLQNMMDSINNLRVTDDMIQTLKCILADLPDEYDQLESMVKSLCKCEEDTE